MPKRTATSELNQDNWNAEEEPEEMGEFKMASKEDLSKRVIKTGRRRLPQTSAAKGSNAFASFGGFGVKEKSDKPFANLFANLAPKTNNNDSLLNKPLNNDTDSSPASKKPLFDKPSSESIFSFKNGPSETSSKEISKDEKQITYLSKLKGLNESFLDWIKTSIEKNPTCILSPIFVDYNNYLKEIKPEKESSQTDSPKPNSTVFSNFEFTNFPKTNDLKLGKTLNGEDTTPEKKSFFKLGETFTGGDSTSEKKSDLKLGQTISGGDSTSEKKSETPLFSFGSNLGTTSFGSSNLNTASFLSGISAAKPPAPAKDDEEEETVSEKYDFKPVVEDEALFSQRVKVFVKKDDNYKDKGVGTLFIKNVSGKHQAIVRADTNLGNILLNIILNKDTPSERVGKNNVTLICIPTPDDQPPPVPVLLRVKTSEDADNLLEKINKYKGADSS